MGPTIKSRLTKPIVKVLRPRKLVTSMGCLTILSLKMPTTSNIDRDMMLIEDRGSNMDLLSSTAFALAVTYSKSVVAAREVSPVVTIEYDRVLVESKVAFGPLLDHPTAPKRVNELDDGFSVGQPLF